MRCPSGIGALLLICRIGPASLFASVAFLFGSAGLAHAQQMYWADLLTDKIQRANLDGSSVEDLLTEEEVSVPWGVAIDRHAGKIYWAENKVHNSRGHRIRRANLDGSNIEDVIVNLPNVAGIALDAVAGKIYWSFHPNNIATIQRANQDGTEIENVITIGFGSVSGIVVDVCGRKVYWTDGGGHSISRANLDGSNVENLVSTGLDYPHFIALDVSRNNMYWTLGGPIDKIQRANLDGSNLEDVVIIGSAQPGGIALDLAASKMYWTEAEGAIIRRANLDGTEIEDLVTIAERSSLRGIALDVPFCIDCDFDGYGLMGDSSCPNGSAQDCDDTDENTFPGATEVCNAKDNNCNGILDDDEDSDGDGVSDCNDQCAGVDDAVYAPGCSSAIPAISLWGLVVLTLLLLVAGKLFFGLRDVTVGSE